MTHTQWPQHPLLLEMNTWIWLSELSARYGKKITLNTIPDDVLSEETAHVDAVWLMGVWRRSPKAREIAATRPEMQAAYRNALSDFTPDDVVGSPYAVYDYAVDPHVGDLTGLQGVRKRLLQQGKLLVLDFVPNHVAPDHPWAEKHPEFFIRGAEADLATHPNEFFRRGDAIFAHGKDPYFPSWPDTLQANSFSEGYRRIISTTLREIATYADGVRCDMAMLMVDRIFQHTWGERAGPSQQEEFWREVIGRVKHTYPNFKFFAEVYWDMEGELQQQGFDFCYDKRLYDRLLHDSVASIKGHLHAEWDYQSRLVRFVENHDEPRAASSFGVQRSLAAAAIAFTLPGARLVHRDQQVGRQIKLPVELGRTEDEAVIPEIRDFYRTFLPSISKHIQDNGHWRLFHVEGMDFWHSPFISFLWEYEHAVFLIVVNYSAQPQSGDINLNKFGGKLRTMTEEMHQHTIPLPADQTSVTIHADPWGVKLFRLEK